MPLGLLYISAYLKSHDITSTVLDAEALNFGIADILRFARQAEPAIVGLNCHTLNRWTVYEITRCLKLLLPQVRVILGGVHPTLAPVSTLKECPEADAIVSGEGEITCLNIARTGADLSTVPGLYIQKNGEISFTGSQHRVADLDSLPYPDLSDVPVTKYIGYEDQDLPGLWKRAYLCATRGCKYRCSFCTEWSFWSDGNTYRSAGSILAEMHMYEENYGARRFYFYDDTFTDWPDYRVFCDKARSAGIEWSCSTRIEQLTPETIRTLRRGGCREIAVGLESGSGATLRSIRKGWQNRLTRLQVGHAIAACSQAGIKVRAHFIIGFPWESRDDITSTVQFAVGLKKFSLHDANFFTAKIYPGTALARTIQDTAGQAVDLTDAWTIHDSALTQNPKVAAKLRRFNDIARYPLHPHLDSLAVRALARRAWELFFDDAGEDDVEELLWRGIEWR